VPPAVLKNELVIVAMILRRPELAKEAAASVAELVQPALREVADAVCAGTAADAAVRGLEPDSLRERLLDAMSEMERAGDQPDAKRLGSLLKKHAQTVALERKQRSSPRVPRT
jgi:hypothetical protein